MMEPDLQSGGYAYREARPVSKPKVESLPFTVRIVRDQASLLKAVQVRHAAYARHKPEWAQQLSLPEPDDTACDCTVLLAESKWNAQPLGSLRFRINDRRPLWIEQHAALPPWLRGRRLADGWRLAVAPGPNASQVRYAISKAYFQLLGMLGVDASVVAARPPVNRMYEALLFQEVLDGRTVVPDGASDPHCVLAFEMAGAEQRWRQARHPLLDYVFHTRHPDIQIAA